MSSNIDSIFYNSKNFYRKLEQKWNINDLSFIDQTLDEPHGKHVTLELKCYVLYVLNLSNKYEIDFFQ